TTHENLEIPPRSPTIVGSAVETIVWSSDASSRTSSRAPKIRRTRGAAGALLVAEVTDEMLDRRLTQPPLPPLPSPHATGGEDEHQSRQPEEGVRDRRDRGRMGAAALLPLEELCALAAAGLRRFAAAVDRRRRGGHP